MKDIESYNKGMIISQRKESLDIFMYTPMKTDMMKQTLAGIIKEHSGSKDLEMKTIKSSCSYLINEAELATLFFFGKEISDRYIIVSKSDDLLAYIENQLVNSAQEYQDSIKGGCKK